MSSKYWIKLYHEILDDPKMGRLPDNLWRRVVELFLMAGDCDMEGYLPSTGDMAWRLRLDDTELESELEQLSEVDIVERRDGRWFVCKFAERQAPVSNAERQARYRDRQRQEQYYGDEPDDEQCDDGVTELITQPVTNRNTDTDTDTDTEHPTDGEPPPEPEKPPPENQPNGTNKNKLRVELANWFSDTFEIPKPDGRYKELNRVWWTPLLRIAKTCDHDAQRTKDLIMHVVGVMDKDGLTISSPMSVEKTAISEQAKRKRGTHAAHRRNVSPANADAGWQPGAATGLGEQITPDDFTEEEREQHGF